MSLVFNLPCLPFPCNAHTLTICGTVSVTRRAVGGMRTVVRLLLLLASTANSRTHA